MDTPAVSRFFRDPKSGELAVFQVPNLQLGVFLVATLVRWAFHPGGAVGTAVSVVAGVALAWWGVDEVLRGDSMFRRVLGGVVLVGAAASFFLRTR
jgi:hypothetical protein